jgi:hypothetical protein
MEFVNYRNFGLMFTFVQVEIFQPGFESSFISVCSKLIFRLSPGAVRFCRLITSQHNAAQQHFDIKQEATIMPLKQIPEFLDLVSILKPP